MGSRSTLVKYLFLFSYYETYTILSEDGSYQEPVLDLPEKLRRLCNFKFCFQHAMMLFITDTLGVEFLLLQRAAWHSWGISTP